MKSRPYYLLIIFCALLGRSTASAGDVEAALAAALRNLGTAIEKNDAALAQAQFSAAAWSREGDSGQDFFAQGVRKKFELRLVTTQSKGERAVITTDIAIAGKVVDRVYLYAQPKGGRWLIEALDENRGHIEPFLVGHVAAYFRVEDLPQNPALLKLGTLLIDAAAGKPGAHDLLYAQVTDTSSVGYLHLSELRGATCKAAHFLEPMLRLALVFEKPAQSGAEPEIVVLYLRKQDKQSTMWHVFSRSSGRLSAGSMLQDNRFYLKAPPGKLPASTP